MAYFQRAITLKVEFNLSADNEHLHSKEQFANKLKDFIDNWLVVSDTHVIDVQDIYHEGDDNI